MASAPGRRPGGGRPPGEPPGGAELRRLRPPGGRVSLRRAAAGVSLFVLLGSAVAWDSYQGFAASVPHGDPVPALPAGAKDIDGAAQNILLIGNDSRDGATPAELKALSTRDDGGSENTDTPMLLS